MRVFNTLIALWLIFFAQLSLGKSYAHVFSLIEKKEWLGALEAARTVPNSNLLNKIILTQQFLDSKASTTNFENAIQFIKKYPNWIQKHLIIKQAEHKIDKQTNLKLVYNWFTHHSPVTGNGHKYYTMSAVEFCKDPQQKSKLIKNGWVKGKFSATESQEYFEKFNTYFTAQDHKAKLEHLLWHRHTDQAVQLLALTAFPQKSIYETWIKILANDPEADKLFFNLPQTEQLHPGLLYAYLVSKKKQPLDLNSSLGKLLLQAQNDINHEQQWTNLRIYYARELLEQKMYHNAYQVITKYRSQDPTIINEAEWLAGWLALRFLKEPTKALVHFQKVYTVVKRPISIAKVSYWLGRTYQAQRQLKESIDWFRKAASYGQTFYGQLAQAELGIKKLILPRTIKVSPNTIEALNAKESYQVLKLVLKYGSNQLASSYMEPIAANANSESAMAILELAEQYKRPFLVVSASRKTNNVFTLKSYPTVYSLKRSIIETPLVYATIRQESSFDQQAFDYRANDRGLMQIIPVTACETAKSLKVPCDLNRLITDPYYNISIGSKHLYDRIHHYNGSYILGIAAYNAGVSSVNKWLKIFGDPRKMQTPGQIVDWIESIPFTHTRPYVQRVLENLAVYRFLKGQQSLMILRDLSRG